MSSSNIQNPLDFSCYYDESSDEYHIPAGEQVELVESIQQYKDTLEEHFHHYELLKAKNETLEAEVEKLKDFSNWENHPALKHKVVLDDEYYLEHLEDGELIDTDTFRLLKDENEHLDSVVDEYREENKKLKDELQTKEDNKIKEDCATIRTLLGIVNKQLDEENEQLKEKNKELKAKNKQLKKQIDELTLEGSRKTDKIDELIGEKLKLDDEANKLTEEVEEERKISFWRMCESYNGFHKNTNLHDPEWIAEMNAMIEDKFEHSSDFVGWTVEVSGLIIIQTTKMSQKTKKSQKTKMSQKTSN